MSRTVHAPRGTKLNCKNWQIEAAYRMIQNNLDPVVAFDPDNLIGQNRREAERSLPSLADRMVKSASELFDVVDLVLVTQDAGAQLEAARQSYPEKLLIEAFKFSF